MFLRTKLKVGPSELLGVINMLPIKAKICIT